MRTLCAWNRPEVQSGAQSVSVSLRVLRLMEMSWLGLLMVLPGLCWVRAYPSGAPTGACEDMMPRHMGVQPQTPPAPYTLRTDSKMFQLGSPITVTIVGPDYRGVLLEARTEGSTTALGTWQLPPPDTRFLECSGNPQGAVTHSNINTKGNSTVYSWIPSDTSSPVYFTATVAQQRAVFWLNVRSNTLRRAPAAGVGLASGTGAGLAPGGLLTLSALLCCLFFVLLL